MTSKPSVALGVIVAPGLAEDVTQRVAADLAEDLRKSYESVGWQTDLIVDRLVVPPASTPEILDAARRKLLDSNWDLGVVVTDLPVRVGRRHVSSHVSPAHGVAVVSLPALGPLHLRRRLHRTLVDLLDRLVGEGPNALRELAAESGDRSYFVPAVLLGHLRLLFGMVRANRPWRFAGQLYGALIAAFAAGAFGVVNSDVWRIAGAMGWWRLSLTSAVAVAVTVISIVAVHDLWERAPDARVRPQVVLFNIATSATITIGIIVLYVALFLLVFASSELVVTSGAFERPLGHRLATSDYASLAWFVASLATVGGALGAGLESDEAVQNAAYASDREQRSRANLVSGREPGRPDTAADDASEG
jgi:hypothetical protein